MKKKKTIYIPKQLTQTQQPRKLKAIQIWVPKQSTQETKDVILFNHLAHAIVSTREQESHPSKSSIIKEYDRKLLALIEQDKQGIEINKPKFPSLSVNEKKTFEFKIVNNGKDNCTLESIHLHPQLSEFELQYESNTHIDKGGYCIVKLTCTPMNLGLLRSVLIFNFSNCVIGRYVSIHIQDKELAAQLKPSSPYQGNHAIKAAATVIIPGLPLENEQERRTRNILPPFLVPRRLRRAFESGDVQQLQQSIKKMNFTEKNYSQIFQELLWLEELQMEVDIRKYDMDTSMRHEQGYLVLNVPGLAEKRPSIMLDDQIFVSFPEDDIQSNKQTKGKQSNSKNNENNDSKQEIKMSKEWQGYVHKIQAERVFLKFSSEFHRLYINNRPCHVRFTFSRTPLRRLHHAAANRSTIPYSLLFPPSQLSTNLNIDDSKIKWFDSNLNQKQRQAVAHIIQRIDASVPYTIFGPPGTGKTKTVVEAIKQIWKNNSKSYILACAPSNSAADLLVERLRSHITNKEMIRLCAAQRDPQSIPREVLPFCTDASRGLFSVPDVERLMKYRVVVCTCSSAGLLYTYGVHSEHFTHVFVDESGHAVEPECIVPLVGLISNKTSVVLAGDPKQLGPVVRSPIAKTALETSLLERLTSQQLYARREDGTYNPNVITKLVENYRSHTSILSLPSKMFYDNELIPKANEMLTNSLLKWDMLPNKEFPIIFHGIKGKDQREANSPSWFNSTEAIQVIKYIQSLQQMKPPVRLDEIGVITPYRKQVEKIRMLLNRQKLNDVKVGSVEEFQGQERRVIIISTVRSNSDWIEFDLEHNLGFLKSPKRFNVAITRAQALLIIIGDPHVLSVDKHWGELIQYCRQHKGYIGCHFDVNFQTKAAEMLQHCQSKMSQVSLQEDPEWDTRI